MTCENCKVIKHRLDIQIENNQDLLKEVAFLKEEKEDLQIRLELLESEVSRYRSELIQNAAPR